MRVLIVHNRYQQAGGEDAVVKQEAALLRQGGHTVIEYYRDNDEINALSLADKVTLPKRVIWADNAVRDLDKLIQKDKPDVAHFHNTFFMISPAAYYACQKANLPVIQTLHNYRLLCANALFFRQGQVCEDCLNKTLPWPGILHGCYHHSFLQSTLVVTAFTFHRLLKTWLNQVDTYITPTLFTRQKFIQAGMAPEKIRVKPHFIDPDPGSGEGPGEYALFVGRLSVEKGIRVLLQAWQSLRSIPLKIVGDGPLRDEAQKFVRTQSMEQVELLGPRTSEEVVALMKKANYLVFPSESYETFGRVAAESFACGLPVIASRIGAAAEIVEDGRTGLHFLPGNPEDLATKVEWAWTHPEVRKELGREARRDYESKYTAKQNYNILMNIYQQAIGKQQ